MHQNFCPTYFMQPKHKRTFTTPGIRALKSLSEKDMLALFKKFFDGDWGNIPAEDAEENTISANSGRGMVLAEYLHITTRIWIVIDGGWQACTMMLPEEY